MPERREGGCLCGAVRYELDWPPLAQVTCSCRNCQKQAGSALSVVLVFRREAVRLTGPLATYDDRGSSGQVVHRRFCPACGSPVYLTYPAMPDLITVHAASLDDPARFKPQAITYGMRGHAWDLLDPALPKFDKMPPAASS